MQQSMKTSLWQQFGAAIDMLENAIRACPEALWGDRTQQPEFWYTAFHALFYLDLYLSRTDAGFKPPAPFTLDEMDERGILPDRVYRKDELLSYLAHGRAKCRETMSSLTEEMLEERSGFSWLDLNRIEVHLYNMRHVQHHAGQLNTLLRQHGIPVPRWVRMTVVPIDERK